MAQAWADISMSLDGFVTGPYAGLEHGMGIGGEALHTWAMDSDDPVDRAAVAVSTGSTGVVVMGRTLFDIIDGPNGWGDGVGYGGERERVEPQPVLVVTHEPPRSTRLGDRFSFRTGHLDETMAAARELAGDSDVVVMGGGSLVRQVVEQRLVDGLRIHLSPLILGSGTPLFTGGGLHRLEQVDVRVSAYATHLTYLIS